MRDANSGGGVRADVRLVVAVGFVQRGISTCARKAMDTAAEAWRRVISVIAGPN